MKVIPYLDGRIEQFEDRIARLESRAQQLTKVLDGLPHGSVSKDIMLNYATQIIYLREQKDWLENILYDVEAELEDYICAKVPDEMAQKVIAFHYILGESFADSAKYLGISESRAYYLHAKWIGEIRD